MAIPNIGIGNTIIKNWTIIGQILQLQRNFCYELYCQAENSTDKFGYHTEIQI